jgi:hypothetical protein
MIRKSLFWGLTVVLIVALVNLIIRGRRLEKQQARQLVEVVQESRPTSTRVLAPRDLEIVQSKMRLEEADGKTRSQIARHEIEIRNNGKIPYSGIQLGFDYLDRSGKLLSTKTQSLARSIEPGGDLKLVEIVVSGLPLPTISFRVVVVSADIGLAPPSQD